jgi:putative sterol carrier protein
MPSSAREFFAGLEERIDPGRAQRMRASYRFEIENTGTWRLEVADGRVSVSESDAPADCVLRASEETFLRILRGEQSPTTAFMTGKIRVEGDVGLALKLRELVG